MVGTRSPSQYNVGQRVRLLGHLSSQNKWNEAKELRQKLVIKAYEFEVLANEFSLQPDKNDIVLKSQISSDIDNTVDQIEFMMSTQHVPR